MDDLYDYLNDGNYDYAEEDSFANHLDYVEELGFNTDNATILNLDYCVKCAVDNDYPEALVAYLQAKTGTLWNTRNFLAIPKAITAHSFIAKPLTIPQL